MPALAEGALPPPTYAEDGLRRNLALVLASTVAASLACGGLPLAMDSDLPIVDEVAARLSESPEVAELLDAEDPEGSWSNEQRTERAAAVQSFLDDTEDFASWRAAVLDRLSSAPTGTEEAYEEVVEAFTGGEPSAVGCVDRACGAIVLVNHRWSVDEDQVALAEAIRQAFGGTKAAVGELERGAAAVALTLDEETLREVDLSEGLAEDHLTVGYVAVDREGSAAWVEGADADTVIAALALASGICPSTGCPEGMSEPRPVGRRRARPAPAPPAPEPAPPAPEPEPELELPEEPIEIPDLDTPEPSSRRQRRRRR